MQKLPLTVQTTLLGAARLLRERGWCTFHLEAPDGRLCLFGAIQRVVADAQVGDRVVADNLVTDAVTKLTQAIWQLPNGAGMPSGVERPSATAWNDKGCKSAEEAIAVLERAAGLAGTA